MMPLFEMEENKRPEIDGLTIGLDFLDSKTLFFQLRSHASTKLEELEVHLLCPQSRTQSPEMVTQMVTQLGLRLPRQFLPKPLGRNAWGTRRNSLRSRHWRLQCNCVSPQWKWTKEKLQDNTERNMCWLCMQRESKVKPIWMLSSHLLIPFEPLRASRCSLCEHQNSSLCKECARKRNHMEVGAPNILLADNAQTETGKKWTKTGRDNAT
jgi:hypothetical protein